MPATIVSAARSFRSMLAGLDVGAYSGSDCASLVEELAATEKACAGVRLLAARRAVECKAHEQKGFTDGSAWLATQAGITPSEAKRNLRTAGVLDDHPETKDALVAGRLSLDQAEEIVDTDREVRGSEKQLVDLAGGKDLTGLREAARDTRHKAVDPSGLHQRQHRARHLRAWANRLGNICGEFELAPEVGIPLLKRLGRLADQLRAEAKTKARTDPGFKVESWNAYAADALAGMLNHPGHPKTRPGQTDLVIVCDLRAWRRGHPHPGEPCHIIDGTPIPVDLAKQLSQDAFLSVVLHDNVDILALTRMGRHIPAHLRAALDIGEPPDFTGMKCVDCAKRHRLQLDHVDPIANDGPTSYHNLKPRCYSDHQHKTRQDRKAGLLKPRRKARGDPQESEGP